jgi:hypothetical protein
MKGIVIHENYNPPRTWVPVPVCWDRNRWRGMTCREAWSVSRFAWCEPCRRGK